MSSENLSELHNSETKPGVYVAIKVDEKDRSKVLDFCENVLHLNMENSSSPYSSVTESMHATLLAAKDAKNHDKDSVGKHIFVDEFNAKPTHWEVFESSNTGKRCLVLKLDCPEMNEFHEKLKKTTGLIHTFNDFVMHISVNYNYKGEIPTEVPDFTIKFRGVYAKSYLFKSLNKPKGESIDACGIKEFIGIGVQKELNSAVYSSEKAVERMQKIKLSANNRGIESPRLKM